MRNPMLRTALYVLTLSMCTAANAQTVSHPGSRSLRIREMTKKAGAERQVFVVPDADHVFPYLLASSAWTTTLHLTNLEDHDISVTCEFVGTNGEERAFKFSFMGEEEPTAFTTSRISKLATESFSTVSTATTLTTAWVYCSAEPRTDRFSGYAVVRNTTSTGASRDFVTTLQPESEPVFSVPFLDAATNTTGLILLNSALEEDSSLALWVLDRDGKTVGTGTVTLKPGNLRVIVLNDAFKDVKSGTVRVVAVEGSKLVTGLALRTNAAGYAALTPLTPKEALPVPVETPATPEP